MKISFFFRWCQKNICRIHVHTNQDRVPKLIASTGNFVNTVPKFTREILRAVIPAFFVRSSKPRILAPSSRYGTVDKIVVSKMNVYRIHFRHYDFIGSVTLVIRSTTPAQMKFGAVSIRGFHEKGRNGCSQVSLRWQ